MGGRRQEPVVVHDHALVHEGGYDGGDAGDEVGYVGAVGFELVANSVRRHRDGAAWAEPDGLVAQVGYFEGDAPREPMVDGDERGLAGRRELGEPKRRRGVRHGCIGRGPEVDDALAQETDRVRGAHWYEREAQGRLRHVEQERDGVARGVVDAHAYRARCGSLRHGARQAHGLVVVGDYPFERFVQERAFGGERRAGARAVEHLEAQLVLDHFQLIGEGRLGDVQLLRSGRHRLALGKHEHHAHLRYVHAFTSLGIQSFKLRNCTAWTGVRYNSRVRKRFIGTAGLPPIPPEIDSR